MTVSASRQSRTAGAKQCGEEFHRATPVGELPEFLTVEEVGCYLGIGRSLAYALVRSGELPSVRLGRRVLVSKQALETLARSRKTH